MRLEGKVAIVTGAGAGIGLGIAEAFAREGARLVLNDVHKATLTHAGKLATQSGARLALVPGDVSRAATARRLARTAREKFGRLDILVNNAGISGSPYGDGPVTESRESAWDNILRINLKSVFLCSRYAIPEMNAGGGGVVLNMSSVLALTASAEHFKSHAYVASKGAILSLTRAMAAHYARQGVRVNALCPGLIATPMSARHGRNRSLERYLAQKQALVGGFGSVADVAGAAVFLASDDAKFITGAALPIDGGWSAGD